MRIALLAAAGFLAFVAPAQALCPRVKVLQDTDRWITLPGGDGPQVEGKISEPAISCKRGDDELELTVTFKMEMSADKAGSMMIPYYAAVIFVWAAEPAIVYKDIVQRQIEFPAGKTVIKLEETVDGIELPLGNRIGATDFEVVVGFQLSMAQLEAIRH
ncbi:MAG TPA: hypothetical protein DCL54_16075 [Alphaproteobacteria bacterium]|nr:hypothetical protein [Alphaproteobacteria bacterium]HAJ48090.1 hypothetical protein [Alphaproteobacteria bacterium]